MKKIMLGFLALVSLSSVSFAQCDWGTTYSTTCPACAWSVLGNPFSGWAVKWKMVTKATTSNPCVPRAEWIVSTTTGSCGSCG